MDPRPEPHPKWDASPSQNAVHIFTHFFLPHSSLAKPVYQRTAKFLGCGQKLEHIFLFLFILLWLTHHIFGLFGTFCPKLNCFGTWLFGPRLDPKGFSRVNLDDIGGCVISLEWKQWRTIKGINQTNISNYRAEDLPPYYYCLFLLCIKQQPALMMHFWS